MRSLYCPSPHWGRKENWKKKTKLMGWDEGNLIKLPKKENSSNNNTDKENAQSKW